MEEVDLTLVATQKNVVLRIVTEYGFDPRHFEWKTTTQDEHKPNDFAIAFRYTVSVLMHKETGYYFRFEKHRSTYSPGHQLRTNIETWDRLIDQQEHIRDWLSNLKSEVAEPDLWASIGQERALSDAASYTSDNHPFTPAEQKVVAKALEDLKQHLLTEQEFQVEQAKVIEERFTYLKEASERLGRKDWLNTALGGFVGLIVGLALDPDKARSLLGMAGNLFQWVWAGAQSLLR
jgi:hypothetical protein